MSSHEGAHTEGDPQEEGWNLQIRTSESVQNKVGKSNAITTTKYSLITWLPKSLWEQFRRVANVYFLIISILMIIGTYATYIFTSPLNPWSTVLTLVFVLLVTSFKEGSEDLQRYRSDREENTRKVTVCTFNDAGELVETVKETRLVQAGDIIKMTGKTSVPVDLLLILTSLHADGNQCYVETANIDGETNLKLREAPAALAPMLNGGIPTRELFEGVVEAEAPNKNIHNFIGRLCLKSIPDPIALSADNILLRSSLFSNTEWAYGIAVYTGQETKIQMNNKLAPSKMSKLEKYLNKAIILIFFAQVILVSMSVISIYILGFQTHGDLTYIYPKGTSTTSVLPLWLEQWFIFFLLYNNFIPISLYVSIEMVNLGQSFLIANDEQIYEPDLDCRCIVRSSNLVQELGQVSNIFSDKTGTLTRNEMKLVNFVVNGKMYNVESKHEEGAACPVRAVLNMPNATQSGVYKFLRCLTACHTVIREKDGTYRAESPDELALVEGVGVFGCNLKERGTTIMNVEIAGEPKVLEVLAVNQFNADRKRMSVVIRDPATNKYLALCKGADNIMLPLCACYTDSVQKSSIEKSLMDLACLGLRTLCIAEKELSEEVALAWIAKWKAASSSLESRAEKLAAVAAELETNMDFLGITAIEDRLQDEVPEVIADLAKAGIVVWMLTGDKEETAVNIGRSCNLLLQDTRTFFLTKVESDEAFTSRLESIHNTITNGYVADTGYVEDGKAMEVALVLDGPSFKSFNEENLTHRKQILAIGQLCRSVIACRLTPIQKQQLVALVKKDTVPAATCLSIGDGANDVSMIREANVGVGIFGKEGRQAANNSDVAIGQFKYLRRLLLVHGRWNYIRQSRVFLYSMHKNMVITLTLFWYSYFTRVSGTSLYESWVYTGFNFILGLPIIFFGIMDRDLSDTFVCKFPQTYSTGKSNTYLQLSAIGMWIFNACLTATIICLLFFYTMSLSFQYYDLYSMGTTVFVGLCNALQLKVIFLHHQWDALRVFLMCLSVGGMLAYFMILAGMMDDYWHVANFLYSDNLFWLYGFFTVPVFILYIDAATFFLKSAFFPSKETLYREAEQIEEYKKDPLALLRSNVTFPGWHRSQQNANAGGGLEQHMEEGEDGLPMDEIQKQKKRGTSTRSL